MGFGITALLGPTNTGKTHRAIERMLEHESGMIGLPLRLLAREVYDRVSAKVGEEAVALVTGEEKRIPRRPRYWVCTVESMPQDHAVDFVAIDEIQLAAHRQRGHTFTDRLLRFRGEKETMLMGSETMRPLVEELVPTAWIEQHPRYSQLTYTGTHSLASLPPRTAVVAFSAEDVYAIAERLRRRHGGTAVVLGALSPRTRNAQVAMYQAGEVQHMVATDAIGMGLNMDVDRVVFASLRKFDGRESRALDIAEMAQIAGRAGRYTTDGGFGLLRPQSPLPPRVVTAIEEHRFVPVRRLVWRSAALDFSSVDALIESLRQRPRKRSLRLVEQADDFECLVRMSKRAGVRAVANNPDTVELLWEVCRIPDFRKLLLDSHVELLAAIFEQLSGPAAAIDQDWMAGRINRLDEATGDIDTLMRRIAFIRTWTYITNHADWVADPEQWQARTRQIEDKCSDALHERLTERFVEGHASDNHPAGAPLRRKVKASRPVTAVVVEGSPFADLAQLHSDLPDAPGEPASEDAQARLRWVEGAVEAEFTMLRMGADGRLTFQDQPFAILRGGTELLHPEVVVLAEDVGAGARAQLLRRAQAWVHDAIAKLTEPPLPKLLPEADALPPEARGLIYQLEQGLGIIDRRDAREQLRRIPAGIVKRLEEAGISVGRRVIHIEDGLGATGMAWRGALWCAYAKPPVRPTLPETGAVSVEPAAEVDPVFYLRVGYPVIAGRAVRIDQLERTAKHLAGLGQGPWPLPAELGSWLGVRRQRVEAIVRALGYRNDDEGWSPGRRPKGRASKDGFPGSRGRRSRSRGNSSGKR